MTITDSRLARRLGLFDAVCVGLGAMIGAGVFAVFGPAARAAGSGLLVGLVIAAAVAFCNAASSAQLAAVYPTSGGTYAYGRARLGEMWGFLAGWGFVVGKIASCAAMALTFATYAVPNGRRALAVAAVAALTLVNYGGVRKSVAVTKVVLAVVLVALAAAVVASLGGGTASSAHVGDVAGDGGVSGVLQSAGLLFFAFAGYARLATLGEEVIEPERTIPRAIPVALGVTLVLYALVAASALSAVGPDALAGSSRPLVTAVEAGSLDWLSPLVRAGGVVAALGVLLSLILGVSRTVFAMAANGDAPRWLAATHPRTRIPHRADLAVGGLVIALVLIVDLRGAVGFSSFAVLAYYTIANASAWTLPRDQRRWPRAISALGAAGCVILAATLPARSAITGAAVLLVGVAVWALRRRTSPRR